VGEVKCPHSPSPLSKMERGLGERRKSVL